MGRMKELDATLSEVRFTAAQVKAAIALLRPVQDEAGVVEHAMILADFVRDERIEPCDAAAIALHARIVAMDRWCARHDPHGQTDVDAFFEAAARAPLAWTEDGRGFEPMAFGELVEFIAELPF
jgi:hypothetical protein